MFKIPHGHLSIGFIDYKNLPESSYNNSRIKDYKSLRPTLLANAIYFHHKRDNVAYSEEEIREKLKTEFEEIKKESIHFLNPELQEIKPVKIPSGRYCSYSLMDIQPEGEDSSEVYMEFAKLKGFLNKIDFAASSHEKVEYPNYFLEDHLKTFIDTLKNTNPNAKWNELQTYMLNNRDKNIVAVAQTGMGKTEAGLLWIGDNKGFFTLPLKTAINSIYNRIVKDLSGDITKKVALLHSDSALQYLIKQEEKRLNEEVELEIDAYLTRTRQLSIPLTICTIDQILDFVYKYLGSEVKLATLSYSKIIIDEIQMYNPKLLATIITAIKYITKAGGKFSILTATFPSFIFDLLDKEELDYLAPKPFLYSGVRHSLKIIESNINTEIIKEKYNSNKVLVICNTVKEVQRLYDGLDPDLKDKTSIFHSSFIVNDRKAKEKSLLDFSKKENDSSGIWICTQVVEASLDIDFDVLITELSDLNGLFQRLGRCYRKRILEDDKYNVFVFTGTQDKYPSGIGKVVDEDIFLLSKKAIKKVDGKITEEEKVNLLNLVYSRENIRGTEYYKKLTSTMNYLKIIQPDESEKSEILRIFRDINNVDVIPLSVYEKNKDDIEVHSKILRSSLKDFESDKMAKEEKLKSREFIQGLTLSLPFYIYANSKSETINITQYFSIPVVELEYDSKVGVRKMKTKNVIDITDRII